YRRRQVKEHASPDDLWIIVHGKVYDVTAFVNDHPGGEEVLFDQAGMDATEAFDEVGHSQDAHELLERYLIGVVGTTVRSTPSPCIC
ncbi:hypothetical protein CXG81DRAFT_13714, partial [Caulochytrium protostelioides]